MIKRNLWTKSVRILFTRQLIGITKVFRFLSFKVVGYTID